MKSSTLRTLRIAILSSILILTVQMIATAFASDIDSKFVYKTEIRGAIQPSTASHLERMINDAEASTKVSAILIELNTPGGMLEPTREIVSDILSSEVPVITFVSPSGARAGSAGTFIVAASHIAAMAPTTNIGAASPVGASGEELGETIKNKVSQDAAALLRSISEQRGRPSQELELTVTEARSYTSSEAMELGIIDIVSKNHTSLLEEIDGFTVSTPSGNLNMDTSDVEIQIFKRTMLEKFLDAVGDPNITFVLLTIGSIALTLEFIQPGILIGAFIGILAISLAFAGMGQLPVNWLAVALVFGAFVLFFIETQAPGLGLYVAGGIICFVIGSFLLFGNTTMPGFERGIFGVNIWLIGIVGTILTGSIILTLKALSEAVGKSMPSHTSELIGSVGIVRTPLRPLGTVQVGSDLWSAEMQDDRPSPDIGDFVIVKDTDGIKLSVLKKDRD